MNKENQNYESNKTISKVKFFLQILSAVLCFFLFLWSLKVIIYHFNQHTSPIPYPQSQQISNGVIKKVCYDCQLSPSFDLTYNKKLSKYINSYYGLYLLTTNVKDIKVSYSYVLSYRSGSTKDSGLMYEYTFDKDFLTKTSPSNNYPKVDYPFEIIYNPDNKNYSVYLFQSNNMDLTFDEFLKDFNEYMETYISADFSINKIEYKQQIINLSWK